MAESEKTTITLSRRTKERMDRAKIIPRETYEEEIIRLLNQTQNHKLIKEED